LPPSGSPYTKPDSACQSFGSCELREDKKLKNEAGEKTWEKFIEVLSKVREAKAKHNKSLKHEVILTIPDEDMKTLRLVLEDLKAVCKAKEILVGKFNISL